MAGVKGAKLAARALHGASRKHYCPTCIGDAKELTADMEAKPVMLMPGRRMRFSCKAEHRITRKGTVLI